MAISTNDLHGPTHLDLDPNSPWLKSAPLLKSFDAENVSS
jgi:hypothetical protein